MSATLSNDFRKRVQQLSPEKRALLEQRYLEVARDLAECKIPRTRHDARQVLSFGQQQLWLLDQLNPGTSAYNVPYPLHLRGTLYLEAFKKALDAIVGRHEVLRTLFVNLRGQPTPFVAKRWSVEFRQVDLVNVPEHKRAREAQRLMREDAARPFDLARDLKLRTTLYRLDEEEYIFLHVSHHISWDLRSKEIFYEELGLLYNALAEGRECILPELKIQYADYASWQRSYLQGVTLNGLTEYWKRQLSDAPPSLDIPSDRVRPPVQSLRGAKYPVVLSASLLDAARLLSRRCGVTLYMLFLSVLKIFLFCYTGCEDLCIGSPFTVRSKETNSIIGTFINTLVLRTRVSQELTFREIMGRVRDATVGAIAHQDLPFEKIVQAVRPPRDPSRNPLFQVNFRLQGATRPTLQMAGVNAESLDLVENYSAKFDLALELPSSPQSSGYWEYSTDLFDERTVARMAADFHILLNALMKQPDLKLKELNAVRRISRYA